MLFDCLGALDWVGRGAGRDNAVFTHADNDGVRQFYSGDTEFAALSAIIASLAFGVGPVYMQIRITFDGGLDAIPDPG